LTVRLFGDLEVTRGTGRVEVAGLSNHLSGRLLAHIVLGNAWGVSREALISRFWPLRYGNSARNSFYVAWSKLKRAIENDTYHYIRNDNITLRVDHDKVYTDTGEFKALYKELLFSEKDSAEKMELVARMEGLYRSGILPGYGYDLSIKDYQQRYRELMAEALLVAVGTYMQQGERQKARWYAMRAAEVDPERKDVFMALIQPTGKDAHRIIDIRELLGKKVADSVGEASPFPATTVRAAQV
jgi:DNA-binding SARP family transcriptional activator